MTPPRSSTFLDTSLHKDVFGVISGTGEWEDNAETNGTKTSINFFYSFCFIASPHAVSTPNINSVRHADSRGSLISTDSVNSLLEKHNDKANSLDKVYIRSNSYTDLLD